MLRTLIITVTILTTLAMFSGCKAREDEPADNTVSKDKPSSGTASKAKPTLVTSIARDALLKFMKITPYRVEAFEYGWLVTSKQRLSSIRIAVCHSREDAQALYQHNLMRRSVWPPATVLGLPEGFKAGDQCVIYRTNITFVRDNVFVGVGWRSGTIDHRLIKRLDDLLRAESAIVKRGQFKEVPELQFTEVSGLKIAQEPIVVVAGEKKKMQVAWSGMGEKKPMFYLSSPGPMNNYMVDATEQLILSCITPGEYPVTVYAVGEGLVYAKATINVIVRSAKTQSSDTQSGESDISPATRSDEPPRRDKTP